MKRRLLQLGLLLLFGAIINVAVAWGCPLFISLDWQERLQNSMDGGVLTPEHGYQHWLVDSLSKPGAFELSSQWADDNILIVLSGGSPDSRPEPLIPGWAWFALPPRQSGSQDLWHYRWIDARGWPLLACWTGISCETESSVDSDAVQTLGGVALDHPNLGSMPSLGRHQRFLSFSPIWPGFAINTIFYAALVWLLFFAPFKLRRWRRIRRGLCPACAYPLGTSDKCTECGKPLSAVPPLPLGEGRGEGEARDG